MIDDEEDMDLGALDEFMSEHATHGPEDTLDHITIEEERFDTFVDVTVTCTGCDGTNMPNVFRCRVTYETIERHNKFHAELAEMIRRGSVR